LKDDVKAILNDPKFKPYFDLFERYDNLSFADKRRLLDEMFK